MSDPHRGPGDQTWDIPKDPPSIKRLTPQEQVTALENIVQEFEYVANEMRRSITSGGFHDDVEWLPHAKVRMANARILALGAAYRLNQFLEQS